MARLLYNALEVPALSADISAVDTAVTFAAQLREYGTTPIPDIAAPDYLPLYRAGEVVYLTAYNSTTLAGTISRGQEDSIAVAHTATGTTATPFKHGPTKEDAAASISAGLLAARPAASAGNAGHLYFATDVDGGTLYRSNGSSWAQVAASVDLSGQYRVDEDPITLEATRGVLITGTPAAANRAGFNAWSYDAATAETVGFSTVLPASWLTYDLAIVWTNAGAGAGNVVWRYDHKDKGDGDTVAGAATSETAVTVAAPATDVMKRTTLVSGEACPAVGDFLAVQISRIANDGADTLANDAALWFVVIEKAS